MIKAKLPVILKYTDETPFLQKIFFSSSAINLKDMIAFSIKNAEMICYEMKTTSYCSKIITDLSDVVQISYCMRLIRYKTFKPN